MFSLELYNNLRILRYPLSLAFMNERATTLKKKQKLIHKIRHSLLLSMTTKICDSVCTSSYNSILKNIIYIQRYSFYLPSSSTLPERWSAYRGVAKVSDWL